MSEQFLFPTLQIRSGLSTDGGKTVIVKGYAVASNIPHEYMREHDEKGNVIKSFKSMFTNHFVESISRQLQQKPIFVDALHHTAANMSIRAALENIKKKGEAKGDSFQEEIKNIESHLKITQLPLGKPRKFDIDENGMYVELELNPAFRDFDEDHRNYYDAVVASLRNGQINGLSINFKATDVINNGGIDQIDDGLFYGISLVPDAALGEHTGITEVAIRSLMEVRNTMEIPEEKTTTQTETTNNNEAKLAEEYAKLKAEMDAMKAEQEKQKEADEWVKRTEQIKQELMEQFKKEQESQSKPKGVVRDESTNQTETPIKSRDDFKKYVEEELTWKELIQLQADTGAIGTKEAQEKGYLKRESDLKFN